MGSVNLEAETAKGRLEVIEWLNSLFPGLNMPPEASDEDLRAQLLDGTLLCGILSRMNLGSFEESQGGQHVSSERRLANIRRFVLAVEQMGLPSFKVSDLEQGPISAVVTCLLSLKDYLKGVRGTNSPAKGVSRLRNIWKLMEGDKFESLDVSPRGEHSPGVQSPKLSDEDRKQNFQRAIRSPVMPEPSIAMSHHVGLKFHEVFQLKQGRYADLPAAKILEMMKSNSLDNAPTQSLLGVVNGILDESIERKNGEIPHRVACLLRKVVQEIERRISTQADHIRNQNNLIKAREEKYQSRIRVLETLATGPSEETQIVMNQLQQMKTEKDKIEERKKVDEQDVVRLMKEKENFEHMISELKHNLDREKRSHEEHSRHLEAMANETRVQLEEKIKDAECLLVQSRTRTKELENFSQLYSQNWNQKEHIFQKFIGFQLQSLQGLRMTSESIKCQVIESQKRWNEEVITFGGKLKVLTNAAESYHAIFAENQRLYNEVQELKGNIRVYCRIRPFLSGENKKLTTIDYIGENGELLLLNPSKQGKDGQRMFKFNKVFDPKATQEEVYLDTQPLVRSVLDGYNVCIFAYGQTGSGKTYTMSGPKSASKEDWGVNYRALHDLFHISQVRRSTFLYEVDVQMVEIYNEQVRDLLASDGSQKRLGIWNTSQPNGLAVPDASMHPVKSTSDVMELMQLGLANRAVSSTALNERSSRSHSILTVHIRGEDLKARATSRGSLHLVDLAGSERVDRSEVTGNQLKEAQHINKSLSALGDVIFALSQKSAHIPYRNSKLTQVLQSSLGGQAKTLMFVQVNPDVSSYPETMSTLKFAERVSGVELGAARSSKEGKDVRDLMEQVASLKDTIQRKDEEIEQLQLLKDIRPQYQNGISEKRTQNLLRHSSSSPGMQYLGGMRQQEGRVSGGRVVKSTSTAASDPENSSDHSDKYSEGGSHQSMDDFKLQKENVGRAKLAGEDTGQTLPADAELLGFGDADSEDRLSDISDGGLSLGTETEGSINNSVEFTHSNEQGRTTDLKSEKNPRVPSRSPKLVLPKTGQTTSVQPKLNSSSKSPSLRKTTASRVSTSPAKMSRPWQ